MLGASSCEKPRIARRVAVEAANWGEREDVQRLGTLEALVAERIAREAARIVEERIREIVALSDLGLEEVYGFMTSEEAAEFLEPPYASFREIASNLPR